ncbi:MAG TPA: hypothetical protein VF647_04055 [Longimicrobium sp.]|jgi:hypothetical protein
MGHGQPQPAAVAQLARGRPVGRIRRFRSAEPLESSGVQATAVVHQADGVKDAAPRRAVLRRGATAAICAGCNGSRCAVAPGDYDDAREL